MSCGKKVFGRGGRLDLTIDMIAVPFATFQLPHFSLKILSSMPSWPPSRVVTHDKCSIHLWETLTTVLQRLCYVMRDFQRGLLIQQYINFDPNPVSGMISADAFVALDQGAESPSQVSQLLVHALIDSGAGETEYIFEACTAPVVDDE